MTFEAIPINGQTWLICGGRHFADKTMFDSAMGDLIRLKGIPSRVVHGAAHGTDAMADDWATKKFSLQVIRCPADWGRFGMSAGPLRNQGMINRYKPDLVVAFPGGRGTADMVRRAREANIDVAEIKPLSNETDDD